jgi:hypothetical protein
LCRAPCAILSMDGSLKTRNLPEKDEKSYVTDH